MNETKLVVAFCGALLLAAAVGTASAGDARSHSPTTAAASPRTAFSTTSVAGTIQSIDPAARSVTIKTAAGTSLKLSVGGRAAIERNGARSGLNGLTLDDSVTVQYRATTRSLKQLSSSGPAVTTAVGRASVVSVATGTLGIVGKTLQTNASTRIIRNGHVVALRQITLKDMLVGHVPAGTNVALDVLASGPEQDEVHGTITNIDGANVTITPDDGSPPLILVIGVDTLIEFDDASGGPGDLAIGQRVEAGYDPNTLAALSIEVEDDAFEDEEVEGTVTGVDTALGTVTIAPKGGGLEVTLRVEVGTEIEIDDKGANLADIVVGMPIEAEYHPVTLIARKLEVEGPDDESDDDDDDDEDESEDEEEDEEEDEDD